MLNVKQEGFIQNIIKGMSQRQAYKTAYNPKYKDEVIDRRASELFNKSEVQGRYQELLNELKDESIMSAKERMIWLTKVINGEETEECKYYEDGECHIYQKKADLNTKIKALDTLNKMSGEYTTNIKGNLTLTYEEAIKKVSGNNEY